MEDQEWVAFVQSEVEGWGWQLIGKGEWKKSRLRGQAPHPLYKSSIGSCEGIGTTA